MNRQVIKPHLPKRPNLVEEIEKHVREQQGNEGERESGNVRETQVQVRTQINPRDYIQVPQHNIVIAREIGYIGKNWGETLGALARDGLLMPRIDHFMTHFLNVRDAVDDRSNVLLYADGTLVGEDDTLKLWNYLSSRNRRPFNGEVCWSWLDAMFRQTGDKFQIETDHRIGGKLNAYELKRHTHSGWVDLHFNGQGLPTRQFRRQSYSQGKNMYFWQPQDGRVVGFIARSDGTILDCCRIPGYCSNSLGAFACAEGVVLGNAGGSGK